LVNDAKVFLNVKNLPFQSAFQKYLDSVKGEVSFYLPDPDIPVSKKTKNNSNITYTDD